MSRGTYAVGDDGRVEVTLRIAASELDAGFGGDGGLSKLVAAIEVSGDGERCGGGAVRQTPEDDGPVLGVTFDCHSRPEILTVAVPFVERLTDGHRHLVHVTAGTRAADHIAHSVQLSFEVALDSAAPIESASLFGEYFGIGIEHILFGWDHLVFLLALFLVAGSLKAYFWMITAFTLAHSVTLGLAVLGIVAPSGSVVEPIIALSIAWVGVENFRVESVDRRWILTLFFGLVHGFGFAGALGEIGLPAQAIPLTLLAFNLGVEAGQLSVLAVALPLLTLARRSPAFNRTGVFALNVAVVLIGGYWFIERTLL